MQHAIHAAILSFDIPFIYSLSLMNSKYSRKRTKIVCTIGPSSWEPEVLRRMIDNGMNVARINAAFADVPELERVAKLVRSISTDVALMLDIKGCDIRLNKFAEAIELKAGDELIIGSDPEKDTYYMKNHLELYKDLEPGLEVFFDDGLIRANVTKIEDKKVYLKILNGGLLKPNKSLNAPGRVLSVPSVTATDAEQIAFAIKDNWDFVAASFIRNKADALMVKEHVEGSPLQIIAKIEEPLGVQNLDEILEIVDGIMIARGDMGVEMPYEKIPAIQKMMIHKCNAAAKPVITATQVLESMTHSPRPTRAEISDTANAIWDGTDAIMTSGETSAGQYPAETVETISRIAIENENYISPEYIEPFQLEKYPLSIAMSNAAVEVVSSLDLDRVVIVSLNFNTPRILARHGLNVPIVALVRNDTQKRQLSLTKGIMPVVFSKSYTDRDNAINGLIEFILEHKLAGKTERVLIMGNSSSESSKFPHLFEIVDLANY